MTTRRLGSVLALWSAGFAVVHVLWAFGWRFAIPDDVQPISERPVFLTYDVTAGVLMLGAAVVAVVLSRGGLPHRLRERLVLATTIGSVLALLRGVPALVIDVVTGELTGLGPTVDLWFTAAGTLGLLLAAAVRREVDGSGAREATPVTAAAGRRLPSRR